MQKPLVFLLSGFAFPFLAVLSEKSSLYLTLAILCFFVYILSFRLWIIEKASLKRKPYILMSHRERLIDSMATILPALLLLLLTLPFLF